MAIGMHSQSGLDDGGYLTSDELLDIRDQPNCLLILGGSPVALELGQFRPNIDGLNLDAANVTIHQGRISVNSHMRTSQPHIFAVGDVSNLTDTTHIAIQQRELAAHNACHLEDSSKQYDDRLETKVVFTDP